MTPEFSPATALVKQSPYWSGREGNERWSAFLDVILRYTTFDAQPESAKAEWSKAEQVMRDAIQARQQQQQGQ